MKTREAITKTYNLARGNLAAVIIFTCINIFLIISNSNLFFLFSASIPIFLLYQGAEFSAWTGSYSFALSGIVLAFAAVSSYAIFWLLTRWHKGWILAALMFFTLDILLLLWLILAFPLPNSGGSVVIELAFRAWIMYYLIIGTRAWYQLKQMPPADEPIYDDFGEPITPIAESQNRTIPVAQTPPSSPIRHSPKKGRALVSQNYNNMDIVVKRTFGVTELVVDGMVYAEKTGVHEGKPYILEANVNNVIIHATAEIPSVKEQMKTGTLPTTYLYVNGNLVAEKKRYF